MKIQKIFIVSVLVLLGSIGCGVTETADPTQTSAPARSEMPPTLTVPLPEPDSEPTFTPKPTVLPATPTTVLSPTPAGPSATVIDIINDVSAHALPEEAWQAAWVDMAIFLGGEVWAAEASTSRVEITGNMIRVAPNTIFTFEQPDANTFQLDLQEGQVWVNIEGLEAGQSFEVQTLDAVASVRGTLFTVRATAETGTLVATQEGAVVLQAAAEEVTVSPGFESVALPGAPPAPPVTMSLLEQLRWGMAAGADLSVVLPANQLVAQFLERGRLSNPRISADGRYLAYTAVSTTPDVFTTTLKVINLDSGALEKEVVPDDGDGAEFSPTRPQLAYTRYTFPTPQICVVNTEDWQEPACFDGANYYGWPHWSPDGEWLLFYASLEAGDPALNLYRARPDGSDFSRLTSGSADDKTSPAWSPDGSQIAYMVRPVGDYEAPGQLWVMNADGTGARLIFDNGYAHATPLWLPDSSGLIVRGSVSGLWQAPLDGSDMQQLPGTEGVSCYNPTWSPTGQGWPLFYNGYSSESPSARLYYVSEDQLPRLLANPTWGPIWAADGSRAAFGYFDESAEPAQTLVYILATEVDFYP